MSKISYPQLVKNLADAYRLATGNTEPIIIGELSNKITTAIESGTGKSIDYKSIVYNEDNTITLIDNENVVHTIVCDYENDNITSITYDNEKVKLGYSGDDLRVIDTQWVELYDAPQLNVANIIYKSITYNADNSITLVDENDIVYTVKCVYENGKMVSMSKNDVEINLIYDGDELVSIGDTEVNFEYALANNRFIYKSVTYNNDNSITLIDNNDIVHTMICTYGGGMLSSISFDGQEMNFNYNGESSISIENAHLNLENVPLLNTTPSHTSTQTSSVEVISPAHINTQSYTVNNNIETTTSVSIESEE